MLSAICELVKGGLSVSHAAARLRIHHSTASRWRSELPEFDAAILAAEAEFIDSQIANIRSAAKTSWQASAWLLERKWPAYFSQPQVQLNMPVNAEYKELSVLIEEIRASPEAMRLLPAGLFDSIVNSGQSTAEGKESSRTSDSETNPDSELKTGDAV